MNLLPPSGPARASSINYCEWVRLRSPPSESWQVSERPELLDESSGTSDLSASPWTWYLRALAWHVHARGHMITSPVLEA